MVVRSKGFFYSKVITPAVNGHLDWVFEDSAVTEVDETQATGQAALQERGFQQAALEKHWEDIRRAAGDIASRIRIEPNEEERWSIVIPRPKGAVERRLWQDLRVHTPDHEV